MDHERKREHLQQAKNVVMPETWRRIRTAVTAFDYKVHQFIDGSRERFLDVDIAAQLLASGNILVWNLYTPGLIVDGTNQHAIEKIRRLKHIEKGKERPFVSVAPMHSLESVIDISAHTARQQDFLSSPGQLVHPEGHPLFYRVYGQSRFQPPVVREEPNGDKTMITLLHANPKVAELLERGSWYKKQLYGKNADFLLAGSSANPTGNTQPTTLAELDTYTIRRVAGIVDVTDFRHKLVENGGAIPMIDLVDNEGRILRESGKGMYEPIPIHPQLAQLIHRKPIVSSIA